MHLSPHFAIEELTRTGHSGISNTPDAETINRLTVLAITALEPIRARFGSIRVTSGFRTRELNEAIGGAKDSAHLYGCAADIQAINGATPTEIVAWVVRESNIVYDQVIDERAGNSAWVHIGLLRPNHESRPRREALVMRNGKYRRFA